MPKVLVLDAQQRSALAAVRSLGQRGITVHVADHNLPTLAGASRHATSELRCPEATRQPEAFKDWVIEHVQTLRVDAVLPLTDVSVMLLAPERHRIPAKLLCAPEDAYNRVSDKARLIDLAEQVGVRVPNTHITHSRAQLEHWLGQCRYPTVLKPSRSKVIVNGEVISTGVCIAQSWQDGQKYVAQQQWLASAPCLVQDYIPGQGAGVFALYSHGEPITWFSHRRIREKPPSGGVSVLSQSAAVDPELRELAQRLLGACTWDGPAMVEFKIGLDGHAYLMEINGRLWGSLQLAIDCGVDFPWLMYQSALGSHPEASRNYAVGRRLRWLLGDVDNLAIQLRQADVKLASKLGAARDFLTSFASPSSRQEVFRWSDPKPAVRELRSWIKGR